MLRISLLLGLLGLLSACATLDEGECRSADWYEIGFNDGKDGRSQGHFSRHVKACERHGITPRQAPWREGREAGLRLFCVPERAYQIGKRGGSFPGVCRASEIAEMRPAFDWGREYHELSAEIAELEDAIDERLDELRGLEDPDDPLFDLYALYNFQDERRIRRLKRQRERYDHWPAYRI